MRMDSAKKRCLCVCDGGRFTIFRRALDTYRLSANRARTDPKSAAALGHRGAAKFDLQEYHGAVADCTEALTPQLSVVAERRINCKTITAPWPTSQKP